MPIPKARARLYAYDWDVISEIVRFRRANGACEKCGRRHGEQIVQVADGRWYDSRLGTWRDDFGKTAGPPSAQQIQSARLKRVITATAHLDNDPTFDDPRNHKALCGRCHLRHDARYHRLNRQVALRRKRAMGDLFEGPYYHDIPKPVS